MPLHPPNFRGDRAISMHCTLDELLFCLWSVLCQTPRTQRGLCFLAPARLTSLRVKYLLGSGCALGNDVNHDFSLFSSAAILCETIPKFVHSSSRELLFSLIHFSANEPALRLIPPHVSLILCCSWELTSWYSHRFPVLMYCSSKWFSFLMTRDSIFAIKKELYVGVAG